MFPTKFSFNQHNSTKPTYLVLTFSYPNQVIVKNLFCFPIYIPCARYLCVLCTKAETTLAYPKYQLHPLSDIMFLIKYQIFVFITMSAKTSTFITFTTGYCTFSIFQNIPLTLNNSFFPRYI